MNIKFPDSVECLKRLIRLSADMNLVSEQKEFESKLERVEKQKEAVQKNRVHSGRVRSGRARELSAGKNRNVGSAGQSRNVGSAGQRGNKEGLLPPSGSLGPKFNTPGEQLNSGYGPSRTIEKQTVDTHYDDPIGPSISMRPRTAKSRNQALNAMQDDVNDFNVDDLLPD